MKVKVHCPCGTRFEFEVEPVNERMPVPVNCPSCGGNATELANEVIRRQLAAAPAEPPAAVPPPAPPPMRVARMVQPMGAAPAPPPTPPPAQAPVPPPASGGLRIARAAPVAAPVAPAEGVESAEPVAPRPVPQRGAPASPAAPAWKEKLQEGELRPATKRIIFAAVSVLALVGAAWFWYVWFARDPGVVYSLDFPKSTSETGRDVYRSDAFYELVAPNRLLSVKSQNVSLMDVSKQTALWTTHYSSDSAFGQPRIVTTAGDIWVAWPGELMRFDRQTGAQKNLSLPTPVISVTAGDNMLLVVSGDPAGHETVTQFALPDGGVQTAEITASPQPAPRPLPVVQPATLPPGTVEEEQEGTRQAAVSAIARAGVIMGRGNSARANAIPNGADVPQEEPAMDRFLGGSRDFFDAGPNAVWFQNKVLEYREVVVQAMHKAPSKSVLDNPNLTASQGVDVAEEMANNAQRERTGGVDHIDVSRNQVTIHRLFAHDVPDWTGEIIGPPAFLPLKTLDLIIAGTNLVALDKNNKKLWDAKLTYPVSDAFSFDGDQPPPCLETADALYFADKGMLTRFDPATGDVRWRLTSVGISAVQADNHGRLYLDSTTLRPDVIQFSQQVNLRDRDTRVIMQVDPATGKVLWRSEFPGTSYRCLLSGKFLYSSRVWLTQDPLKLEEGPDTHFTLKLLEPATGKMVWNYPLMDKQLIKAEVQKNWILLQFADQVMVLKFFSL